MLPTPETTLNTTIICSLGEENSSGIRGGEAGQSHEQLGKVQGGIKTMWLH